VETVLKMHQAVKEAAVIGVPDKKWGEAIRAVLILNEGYEQSDELAGEIIGFARQRIAGYKLPKGVDFISEDQMPRTATGKILHRVLRDRSQEETG
jgi:fatty-acyl-CoA synthase